MYKFAFTYLVKEDPETWKDFAISLDLLYKNILSKLSCRYKIIIFCEGEPTKKANLILQKLILNENINLSINKISLKSYVNRDKDDIYIKEFPHPSDCRLIFPLGYRDMCKFFAYDVFLDKYFDDTEYFVRLDTDSFFICTNKTFLNQLINISSDYGYIKNTIQYEDKAVSLGFGKTLYKFAKQTKFYKSNPIHYLNICQEATVKPKIFYTNFEIVKLNWARSNNHKDLMKYILNANGIYNFRWGDALIRYYSVSLLRASVEPLRGCLYKHSGIYDSRNILRSLLVKVYSKMRNRLYQNKYERNLSKIDKVFLGIG